MQYISTRDNIKAVSSIEAIKTGMVPKGGLFVPEEIPFITTRQIASWLDLSYSQLAQKIFSFFLASDFSDEEITQITHKAYTKENFTTEEITPLFKLDNQLYILELFHGPTGAFKDIALQVLPHLLSLIIKKVSLNKQLLILVATSGDTGKAALEGFKNIPGIQIVVYYPFQKVSKIQELQMLTTEGSNTQVIALEGNFDDCQNAVKEIFADYNFHTFLKRKGFELSSANSINWGRLLPQIVYYFYTYLDLLRKKHIEQQEKINFVVPTGNFGNILAAWYAKEMGLPIEKLICASNINKVLADFFHTGIYDPNRPLITTISPSMDILISSNLERFLFEISDRQADFMVTLIKNLRELGKFGIEEPLKSKINEIIYSGYADEKDTLSTIKSVYQKYHYLVDPHTAVGIKVYNDYYRSTKIKTKTVVVATATPFKFNKAVFTALTGDYPPPQEEELLLLSKLSAYAGLAIPVWLRDLDQKPRKKQFLCPKNKAQQGLIEVLKLR